jgi:hypothetical protein
LNEAKSIDQALAEAFLKADRLEAPLPERLKLYLGESRELLPERVDLRSARCPHRRQYPLKQPSTRGRGGFA